jgi:competence ComEA-like helix-hairpin-helix protein
MANGYFERGEVYWVRMDTGLGCEQGVGRPGVILSCDSQNNSSSTITVAFCSKQRQAAWEVEVEATGCTSYVKISQIFTVDKSRFGKCIGILNSAEMKEVDDKLESYFDLGYVDEAALKEKESEIADLNLLISEAKTEVAGVKAEIEKKVTEIASLKMEIEMWQKCYGRCMDMLVDTKVNADLKRRTVTPVEPVKPVKVVDPEEPVIVPKQPEPPVEQPKDDRLDINSCTATALKKIGFSMATARKIVEARPFKSVEDLKRVNGLKLTQFRVMEPKLCCNPVIAKPEEPDEETEPVVEAVETPEVVETVVKVNVNTASAKEISAITGINVTQCASIVGYRKKNGPYSCIDDLLKAPNIYPGTINKRRHLMEV